jgi:hypothetical protein
MRTKVAVLLALLFLVSGPLLQDATEVLTNVDFGAEEDASPIQDPDIYLRSSQSGGFRSRPARSKLSLRLLRGFHARLKHVLSLGKIKDPSLLVQFSPLELYKFQHAYRI